jgi:hypothetical protein
MEVKIPSFLSSALDGSGHTLFATLAIKKPPPPHPYLLDRRISGPQSWSVFPPKNFQTQILS